MKKLGIIEEEFIKDIFSNLESIVNLHQDISGMLHEIQNESDTFAKLEKMIAVYEMNSDEFYLYKIYCSNQSNSSRTLKRLAEREHFQEFISVYFYFINLLEWWKKSVTMQTKTFRLASKTNA